MQTSTPGGLKRPRLSADNYTLLKRVALETDYICGGPRAIFADELASGRMREVPDSPSARWRSACLFRTEALETPLVRAFVEVIVECRDHYLAEQADLPGHGTI